MKQKLRIDWFLTEITSKLRIKLANLCFSTITCKVLFDWPHSKLGQYYANRLPNLYEHITKLCERIALLWCNAPSFWTGRLSPTWSYLFAKAAYPPSLKDEMGSPILWNFKKKYIYFVEVLCILTSGCFAHTLLVKISR